MLPHGFERRRLRSLDEVIAAITDLAVRGAPAIGVCAALGLVLGLDETHPKEVRSALDHLYRCAMRLEAARPTAVNLAWAVRRSRSAASGAKSVAEIRERVLGEALRILAEDQESCRRIAAAGRTELTGRHTILTHCNTGRLATAGVGTALGILYAKAAAGDPLRAFVCETRPLLQGARLTVWELLEAGIDVTLIADGAGATLLASGQVDAVVVGADRIAANGDTANKVGTYGLALAAARNGVPFYVCAPWSSFDLALAGAQMIPIEQRSADEVRSLAGRPISPPSVNVWNPAFDITPGDLVTAFITDSGVIRPPYAATIGAARAAGSAP